jgi:hypothetical protein
MLSTDLTLDPSTAITAGTSSATVYSLLPGTTVNVTNRTASAVSQTAPENFRIAHSVRTEKGFKTPANASTPAPDIVFDRHLCRLDINHTQTSRLDPNFRINRSVQILIEVPRLGSESPTVTQVADDLLSIVSMLRASSNANLIRVLAGEG